MSLAAIKNMNIKEFITAISLIIYPHFYFFIFSYFRNNNEQK